MLIQILYQHEYNIISLNQFLNYFDNPQKNIAASWLFAVI